MPTLSRAFIGRIFATLLLDVIADQYIVIVGLRWDGTLGRVRFPKMRIDKALRGPSRLIVAHWSVKHHGRFSVLIT